MFLEIVLNILSVLAIIVFGAFLVVVIADLILCMFDDHGGIIFRRKKKTEVVEEKKETEVKKDDIIVYANQSNPNGTLATTNKQIEKQEVVDGHSVQGIDYDKAMEEQKALNAKRGVAQPAQPRKVEKAPKPKEDVFWDDDKDDDFNDLLDEAIGAAKKSKAVKKEDPKPEPKEEVKVAQKSVIDEETKKELEELKELKEQQKKEIEEFKQLKEDFARQKEEELAVMKDNLDKAKAEELEKIRQEAIKEQEKLEAMQKQLEEEQRKLEEQKLLNEQKILEEQGKLEEEQKLLVAEQEKLEKQRLHAEEQNKLKEQERLAEEQRQLEEKQRELEEKQKELEEMQKEEALLEVQEPIIKETIIKDEEEINKLKYKNLMRMNNRLTRIIRDTERLQTQKMKEQERLAEERRKLLEKERQEKIKEQEKIVELQTANRERLLKQQENLRIKNQINEKLNNASSRVSKYKLDTKVVRVATSQPQPEEHKVVEEVVTTVETIPHTDIEIKTIEKTPLAPVKASSKPLFDKEYYELKLNELDEELREAEKELRVNKSEYIPLTRIHKAYNRDSKKLRKKEMQVAKQKVALYGVNSTKVNPEKKAKLDENLATLAELKDSVTHCEEVIKKNKDRYPVLEKNNRLITKQIDRINEDIKVCEKAIAYYNKHKED